MLVRKLIAVVLFFVATAAAWAEEPEVVARSMFAAMRDRGLNAVPEYIHPDELQRFKDSTFAFLRLTSATPEQMRHEAFGSSTKIEEVQAMPPLVYMQKFVKVLSRRLEGVGAKYEDAEILGRVQERELVHLVVRTRVTGGTIRTGQVRTTQVEVVTLKQSGGAWRTMLSAQIDSIAEQLRIASETAR